MTKECMEIRVNVEPMGAVRMTKSDTWKTDPNHPNPMKRQRDAVRRYFAFKNAILDSCNKANFTLDNCIHLTFCLSMPKSWSEKKKKAYCGQPHKSRPDLDNLIKAVMDSLRKEDGDIYRIYAEKRYSYEGFILIKSISD
jgi:Holliday junction resolvase RusA-like endonuclease